MKYVKYNKSEIISVFYCDEYYKPSDHNLFGPDYIYYNNSLLSHKEYTMNKKIHNTKGPAIVNYLNGNIHNFDFYLNDERLIHIKSNKELRRYIKLQNIL